LLNRHPGDDDRRPANPTWIIPFQGGRAKRFLTRRGFKIALRRVLFCWACAWLWLHPSISAAESARPAAGMFVVWAKGPDGADLGGREANLRQWEARLGLAQSSLLATDFYGGSDAASLDDFDWLPAYWKQKNPKRKLIWSLPLAFKGAPLSSVARGERDFDFARAAEAIAKSTPDAIIRLGWEMNGDWYPWASKDSESDYIAAYRRIASLFKARSPQFSFVWCVNIGLQSGRADLAYPGGDVVDSIGMDVYDNMAGEPDPIKRWRETYLAGPFGLDWLVRFSAQHHKPMSLPEWGVGLHGAPDNPAFVEAMADWIAAHAQAIAFEAYFNAPPSRLDSGRFPRALRAYLKRFSSEAQ
jgi:Glycosyl hydrolase family 26